MRSARSRHLPISGGPRRGFLARAVSNRPQVLLRAAGIANVASEPGMHFSALANVPHLIHKAGLATPKRRLAPRLPSARSGNIRACATTSLGQHLQADKVRPTP